MSASPPLDCLLGRCDSLRAEVFFRADVPPGVAANEAALTGTLAGPDCQHAITLPVTAKLLQNRGPAGEPVPAASTTLVARAILTEPSFWTPELPGLYRLDARLVVAGREVAAWRRPVGLRRLGVRGRSLWLDGRRYVPRALVAPAERVDLPGFRTAALAAAVPDPSEAFLAHGDAEGVAVLALLAAAGRPLDIEAAATAIARWAWHPAVVAAVVPRGVSAEVVEEIATATHSRRGTLLVAWEADGSLPPPAVPVGVELLVVTLPSGGVPHEAWRTEPPALPLVARRLVDEASPPAAASPSRRECDALQADLAGWGTAASARALDWAGYVTG